LAVTSEDALKVSEQVSTPPLHAPAQPVKKEPESAVARKVTIVPEA
jgi:hypothetical protein